ncbi:MexH family multidrug efflux RND transporter periplasmic adaptor subunit [Hymenobacter qilianensis]|uniref:Efflux RND transporter periplasmic adaptor subunit n=2 Tax=Hymenobacter qilianensis TaxID=1385715 RepID=A0A7H0GW86_9BACT|nr:efflux RND transporter periplasmic adaptor subunit [Hymenobacter qilianensis]QNP52552.1 efflux RND transporter periplasmic adaptor subunit [Hymenobacter qilianensis]GGF68673.1 MexH family multidrug efflux RND transporter periplasmic adaptor subunit [Hymenobacter qilianensis]
MQTKEKEVLVPEEIEESRPGRRILWIVLTVAAIAAAVFVKMRYFPSPTAGGKGGPGGKSAPGGGRGGAGGGGGAKAPVQVYVVQPTNLSDQVAATGSVLPDESVVIKSELSGKITSLNIREGQPVKKGQLLFSINADEAQAAIRKQEYNIKLYRDQERRQRTLLEKEYISAQEYEQANNQYLTAQSDLQALRATLDRAFVRAPFDGVLGLTTATVGTYVSPGFEITTLSRVRPVKIDFAVPGRFANNVRVGDVVKVTDEGTNKQYDAKVYAIDPQIDPVSRTQPVRARYANTKDELRPGAFVKVNLQLGASTDALQVPTEAVIPEASGYSVYTVENGKMAPKKVKIGIRSDKVIQITDGLAVGDSVIRTGILQVKPGDAVRVIK